MLSRGYQILYRTVCVCNGSFVGLNDLRVLRPLVVCPSQIATCCSSGNPWTCTSRNIVCFGQRAHWGTLVSSALVSLQCPIWPASLLQFTWLCRILQWMEPRRRLVCVSPSRRQKLTLSIRGPTGILVWVASALWGAGYDHCAARWSSSIWCASSWLASTDLLRCCQPLRNSSKAHQLVMSWT